MSTEYGLFAARESGYHRLNPLTKLVLAGFLMICAVTLPGLWSSYLVFFGLLVPLAAWAGVIRPLWSRIWRVVLPFAASLILIQGFFWQGGSVLFELGLLSFKRQGAEFAVLSTGRILLIVASFVLLSLTTRPDYLMTALVSIGMPASLSYIVLTTLQIIPRFQAKAASILDAQRSRGLEVEGNILRRARALLPLVVPLILGSLVEIDHRAIALEARAFRRPGPRTSLIILLDSAAQNWLRRLLIALAVFLVVYRLVSLFSA